MEGPASLTQRSIYAELRGQATAPASGNTPAQPGPRHNGDIGIIVERNPQVVREAQVIRLPAAHPGGEGVPLALELSLPGGIKDDPGRRGVAEVPRVQVECGRVDGRLPGGAGGIGGVLER